MSEQHQITVEPLVSKDGLTAIGRVLQKHTGRCFDYRDIEKLAEGREIVSKRGKMAKRIRRNWPKQFANLDKLPDTAIAEIGNEAAAHALNKGTYRIEVTNDLHGTVGNFGDSGSCFNPSGCNSHHLDAMSNDGDFSAVRIYKKNGRRIGRTWAFHAWDGATVLFNAYGITIYKAALMLGIAEGKEVRQVSFESEHGECGLYVNTTNCYAIGGDEKRTSYETDLDADGDGEHYDCYCAHCGDGIYTEWGEYHYDENSGNDYCQHCFDSLFSQCGKCDEYVRDNDTVSVYDAHGHSVTVCDDCAMDCTTTCEDCGEDHLDEAIEWIDDDDGDGIAFCTDCIKNFDTCDDCSRTIATGINESYEVIVPVGGGAHGNDYCTSTICADCIDQYEPCPGPCDKFFEGDADNELCPKCRYRLKEGYKHNGAARRSHTRRLEGESGGHCTACAQYFSVSEYFDDNYMCMECQDLKEQYMGDDNCDDCGGFCPSGTLDNGLCLDCSAHKEKANAIKVALDTVQAIEDTDPDTDPEWFKGRPLNAHTANDYLKIVDRPCLTYCGKGQRAGSDLTVCNHCILQTMRLPSMTDKNCDVCDAWCPAGAIEVTRGKFCTACSLEVMRQNRITARECNVRAVITETVY